MQVPKRRSEEERRQRQTTDHHLTPEAIAALRHERKDLQERQRPRVAAEVQRTREMGDLSENAGYQAAKAQLTRMNFRILEIDEELKNAVPIERGAGAGGMVAIGSTVTMVSNGSERTYDILGSQESDPSHGRISYRSPLGAALMGHAVGDDVTITVHGKKITHRIHRVE